MKTINLLINAQKVSACIDGYIPTILEVAQRQGIYIPSLCYHEKLLPYGACRLCIVKIDGNSNYQTACTTRIEDGMVVWTDTEEIKKLRKQIFELILTEHYQNCTTCVKNLNCELQRIASYIGVEKVRFSPIHKNLPVYDKEPFFNRDYNLCILCGRCIRACSEIRKNYTIDFLFRGVETIPGAPFDITGTITPLKDASCEFCGTCVDICPTAALIEKNYHESQNPDRVIKTICPYCGVGCGIMLEVKNNRVVRSVPDNNNPVNEGQLCVKGRFGIKDFVHHRDRLTEPLMKVNTYERFYGKKGEYKFYRDTDFIIVTWDEVLDVIASIFSEHRGDEFALISSAKITNEENYLAQKFARKVMKTNNIDHCARLCHAPSVVALSQTLGSGAMTNTIKELEDSKTILVIGSNTTETHPITALKIKKAASKGAKVIIINPKEIELCRFAYLHLKHKPGTDVALLNGIAKSIVEQNLEDKRFIEERTQGYKEFVDFLNTLDFESIEGITGIKKKIIDDVARIYATEKPAAIVWGMGITQHISGTNNAFAISNLALLTGNIGKPSTGLNPLRGQCNVQGACDMGCLPALFPGYQPVINEEIRKKFESFYNIPLNSTPGITLEEFFTSILEGKIKLLYIIGENPVLSSANSDEVCLALGKVNFLVVQDIFLTETAKYADIVLPACSFAEKEGTFTNTERRVQLLRKAIEPIGNSKPDWQIICEIAQKMGEDGFEYNSPKEIMDEISKLVPIYGGINYERLEEKPLQWPCFDVSHPGTEILHTDKFPIGKAKFMPVKYEKPIEDVDETYPLVLTTERKLFHYHGVLSRKVSGLNDIFPEEYLEIHPADAEMLGLNDGDIVEVKSRRAKIRVKVKITEKVQKGLTSLTFHFFEVPTNKLTNNKILDRISKMPSLKFSAVGIEKVK